MRAQHAISHGNFTEITTTGVENKWLVGYGLAGGLIGGLTFILLQMFVAWIATEQLLIPLILIATIPLQEIPASISLADAIIGGGLFHFAFSAVVGMIFGFVIMAIPKIKLSLLNVVLISTLGGFFLWLIDFYVLAPLLNAPWFATQTNPLIQFIIHTFFFGTVFGLYFGAEVPKRMYIEE